MLQTIIIWILVVLLATLIGMMLMKKRWYIVETAKPETLLLSRSLMEWEVSGMVVFRDEKKRKTIFNKRWVLKITEVLASELEEVREQYREIDKE